jgi:SagB-type dehydrogenase family enzyme
MGIIKLAPPCPWSKPRPKTIWDFQASGVLRLPSMVQRNLGQLEAAMEARQSRRDFAKALTVQQLSDLLWHSFRVRRQGYLNGRPVWESRPVPSGGGCHPIQLLLLRASFLPGTVMIYDPAHHVLGVRNLPNNKLQQRCVNEVEQCLKIGKGIVLWFVADLARSGSRYRNPESLAWRDSGALLATIGLVAQGMGFDCCGLGLHDIPSLRRFLNLSDSVLGVGGCILSGR